MEPEPIAQEPRRSGRIHHEPERYGFLITHDESIVLMGQDEPTTYREAIESPNSAKWLGSMKAKMQSIYDNQVWTFADPLEGGKIIECKWIFKLKDDNTFKGRLVAKGFKQTHDINYDETFSLVLMLKSIRILLAIAAYYYYEIFCKWMSRRLSLMETSSRMFT